LLLLFISIWLLSSCNIEKVPITRMNFDSDEEVLIETGLISQETYTGSIETDGKYLDTSDIEFIIDKPGFVEITVVSFRDGIFTYEVKDLYNGEVSIYAKAKDSDVVTDSKIFTITGLQENPNYDYLIGEVYKYKDVSYEVYDFSFTQKIKSVFEDRYITTEYWFAVVELIITNNSDTIYTAFASNFNLKRDNGQTYEVRPFIY